jgi:hypothetical protein
MSVNVKWNNVFYMLSLPITRLQKGATREMGHCIA